MGERPQRPLDSSSEASRFRLAFELGHAFSTKLDLDELIPLVVTKCREALDAEGVSVLLLDSDTNELYFPYHSQDDRTVAARLSGVRFPADRGIAGSVLASGQPAKVDHPGADHRFYPGVDLLTGVTTRSLLAAPLTCGKKRLGVIEAVNHRGGTPFDNEHLSLLEALAGSIATAIENARRFGRVKEAEERLRAQVGLLQRDLDRRDPFPEIIGISEPMREVFRLMESAAASTIPILVQGETGTGKELVARGIHRTSRRADGPFLAVNCAALTETLLESELFGHRRGAFTGAAGDQAGLFRAASGGTILLDEIGEMSAAMQAKLLRAVQEGEVTPLGDTRPQTVDVRVISATNRDLKAAVAAGRFREDLYFRLAAFPIHLPSLRVRGEDIPPLAALFLARCAQSLRKQIAGFEPATIEIFRKYDWPGNIRQLQNEIARATALARDGDIIRPEHLSPDMVNAEEAGAAGIAAAVDKSYFSRSQRTDSRSQAPAPISAAREHFEAQYIAEALKHYDGNISRAALALGMSRTGLQKKIKRHRLR